MDLYQDCSNYNAGVKNEPALGVTCFSCTHIGKTLQTSSPQNPQGPIKAKTSHGASMVLGNEGLFAASGSHEQDGRQAQLW